MFCHYSTIQIFQLDFCPSAKYMFVITDLVNILKTETVLFPFLREVLVENSSHHPKRLNHEA
jgi:hypothetical protein